MSRKKKRQASQPTAPALMPTPGPAPRPSASGLVYTPRAPYGCDDELTVLARTMKPRHKLFADHVLRGLNGADAVRAAGFDGLAAAQAAAAMIRREDVRRYIALAKREAATSSRVTLSAILERLWLTVCDIQESPIARERAMAHLVKLHTAAGIPQASTSQPSGDAQGGLTDDVVASIETQLLGLRPEPK